MKGDFTRWTYSTTKNYSSVLLQQGRVLLDADWNEQQEIGLAALRTLARDLIGSGAGPLGESGYAVSTRDDDGDGVDEALYLAPGRYYVDGVLCQLHAETSISAQPDLPGIDPLEALTPGRYAVYLDVWEHHVTAIEDPDIKEKALGGVDHTTRKQVVAQARLLALDGLEGDDECALLEDPAALSAFLERDRGRLAASVDPAPPDIDPCVVPPTAGFRGLENQLYRVEIHRAGNDGAVTFKWSRDNGSVVTAWTAHPDPSGQPQLLEVADLGPDSERGFNATGVLVELTDDRLTLAGEPGLLGVLESSDAAARSLELSRVIAPDGSSPPLSAIERGADAFHPRVRRWDCAALRRIDEHDVEDGSQRWLELENGVRVRFEVGRRYRSGDHWMIPARTVDGTIEWSPDGLQPPHGTRHRYACLAIVERTATGGFAIERSCQRYFPAGNALLHLRYVGGDGQPCVLGKTLAEPLAVQVQNGGSPVESAAVRFELLDVPASDGSLEDPSTGDTGQVLVVETDAEGTAAVRFTPASEAAWAVTPALIEQRVRATLLDACGDDTDQHVVFSTHEAQAVEVRYDTAGCPPLSELHASGYETDHVQRALDVLGSNPHLDLIGGDGQEAMPGALLPNPLVVRVGNGAFPMAGREVEFRLVDASNGSDAGSAAWAGWFEGLPAGAVVIAEWSPGRPRAVRVPSDARGLAALAWRLGATPGGQRPGVTARLVPRPPYDHFDPGAAIQFSGRWSRASHVAYDPGCSLLEGATTVQGALDALCREIRRTSCDELVITPGDDVQASFDTIPDGGDARVCIQAGLFSVPSTIRVRGKGQLTITGAGPSTRLSGRELVSVLHFEGCGKVAVRDLAIEALARAPGKEDGIQGALAFRDCAEVEVSRVRIRSEGQHTSRRLAGVQVFTSAEGPSAVPVRIDDCHVEVGHGQVGFLVVDGARVHLERNHALCPEAPRSLRDELGKDATLLAWVGRKLVRGVQFPLTTQINPDFLTTPIAVIDNEEALRFGLVPEPGRTLLVSGLEEWQPDRRRYLVFTVPGEFGNPKLWTTLLAENPPRRPSPGKDVPEGWIDAELRRLRRDLAGIAFGLAGEERAVSAEMLERLKDWADQLERENAVTAGSQGIVVGGRRAPSLARPDDTSKKNLPHNDLYARPPLAPEVHIAKNRVEGFTAGIHVGLSHSGAARNRRLRVLRAQIVDNTVVLRVPSLSRERHGVFLGNAHCSRVRDNNVDITSPPMREWSAMHAGYPVDGIRLWGTYGPTLQVTGNQVIGTTVGIRVHALDPGVSGYPSASWAVRDNSYVGDGAAEALQLGS